ncbi:MAG TPA: hypothetical protein VHH14_09435 [Solirubrobacterales bacterium]|nr:hypothetical protein [Solirubrobacterales bacterium]
MKDFGLGGMGPPHPRKSRIFLYGPDNRLRRVVEKTYKPDRAGAKPLRTDSYKMSPSISKDQQKAFEKHLKLKKGFRAYSHEISGMGKHGPIKGTQTAHGIETRKVPKTILSRAVKGKLPKSHPEYKRYFRR